MHWFSCQSRLDNFEDAWGEVRAAIQDAMGDSTRVIVLLSSLEFRKNFKDISRFVSASFPGVQLLGASSEALLGGRREIEDGPALVALAGAFDARSSVDSLYVPPDSSAHAVLQAIDWRDVRGVVALCDPYSADADKLLEQVREVAPRAPVVGGLLLGGEQSGDHALWTEQGVFDEGSVLLLLRGALRLEPVVSQGARPVGEPRIVLSRRGHVIDAFDTGKPIDVLRGILEEYPRSEWDRMNRAIVLGIGVDEGPVDEGEDFVLGEVIGIDPKTGSMAVAAVLEDYQVVRFMLREPAVAREDLSRQLTRRSSSDPHSRVGAVLSFVSGERGMSFFRSPNHDAQAFAELVENGAHAGIFCGSEIGPIGKKSVVQSFSASAALILED